MQPAMLKHCLRSHPKRFALIACSRKARRAAELEEKHQKTLCVLAFSARGNEAHRKQLDRSRKVRRVAELEKKQH